MTDLIHKLEVGWLSPRCHDTQTCQWPFTSYMKIVIVTKTPFRYQMIWFLVNKYIICNKPNSNVLCKNSWILQTIYTNSWILSTSCKRCNGISYSWGICSPFYFKSIMLLNVTCRYLHEVCSPSLVHKNFKSSNILLDMELNPHLSDCGFESLVPDAEFQVKLYVIYVYFELVFLQGFSSKYMSLIITLYL